VAKYEIVDWILEPSGACPQGHRHLRDAFIQRADSHDVLLAPIDVHHFAVLVRMESEANTFCMALPDALDPSVSVPATIVRCGCGRGYVIAPSRAD
jgi:hypothetical protein